MTITAVSAPINAMDFGLSQARIMPDGGDASDPFINVLAGVVDSERGLKNGLNETGEAPALSEIPAITEPTIPSAPVYPLGIQMEIADQTAVDTSAQAPRQDIQTLTEQADGLIATPQSDTEVSPVDQVEDPENSDGKPEQADGNDVTPVDDKAVQDISIPVPEIILAALPVALTVQATIAPPVNKPETDEAMRQESAQTSPINPTALKAFAPILRQAKPDEETFFNSNSDNSGPEDDNMTESDTESFTDILVKSSDSAPAKQQVDEIRKAIGLANDAGPMANVTGRPTTLNDLPIEIGMRVLEGAREIRIVLSPESLGEIAIKLDIASDSTISAQFSTDNPATLALLMQDASALKRSLDQTGLSTNGSSLQFSLSRDGQQNGNLNDQNSQGHRHQSSNNEIPYPSTNTDLPPVPLKSYSILRLDRTI